jgi:hypothetical protein
VPHSSHDALTAVMQYVVRLQPRRVLDIGPGYGKWGFLVREALDFMDGRHEPHEYAVTIDGLEAFDYKSPLHDWVYTSIRQGDMRLVAPELPAYDLVIMGDVIEHVSKEDGLAVLRALLAKSKNVIVATPDAFFNQEVLDNPYEQHLSLWQREDFREWPYDFQHIGGTNLAIVAGAGATWPTAAVSQANDFAYRIPWMNQSAARPALVKKIYERTVGRG